MLSGTWGPEPAGPWGAGMARIAASLLCYYGDKHRGAARDKGMEIASSSAPGVAVGSPGCHKLLSFAVPCSQPC